MPPIARVWSWHGAPASAGADTGGFDPTVIVDLRAYMDATALHVTWKTTAPAGTWYQVYVNGRLAWEGTDRYVDVPYPSTAGARVLIDVGSVGFANRGVDYSGTFGHAGNRARLSWYGGRYLDRNLRGFNVYGSPGANLPVSLTNKIAYVDAAPGGVWRDGYGRGGYGRGGYGHAEIGYQWTSAVLTSGDWQFAVAGVDAAGNVDPSPPVITQTIATPPSGPVPRADGKRLWVESFDPATGTYTLGWTPPP